jgi:hypothetical protein
LSSSGRLLVTTRDVEIARERRSSLEITQLAFGQSLELLARWINVEPYRLRRVLKPRDSSDSREMRRWLREIDSETDADISKRLFSFREGLAAATHTRSKTVIRFVLTNTAGLLPVFGPVAGPAATEADHLIFEKWIGRPGPATFLGRSYTSIFRRPGKHGIPLDE